MNRPFLLPPVSVKDSPQNRPNVAVFFGWSTCCHPGLRAGSTCLWITSAQTKRRCENSRQESVDGSTSSGRPPILHGLNLVESYFATLQRTFLYNTDYRTPQEIEQGPHQGIEYLNKKPRIYKWKEVSDIYVSHR